MIQHIIQREDGTILRAGEGEPALVSVSLTQSVNSGTELTFGSVCAAMVQITVFGESPLRQGEAFTLLEEQEDGTQIALGMFFCEQPRRTAPNTQTVTAYDTVTQLDRDVSAFLESLAGWPYTLGDLASLLCAECGVSLGTLEFPNHTHPVEKFSAKGITGRQVMGWIAQAAGCFGYADGAGALQLGWYTPTDRAYTPTEFFQGGLQLADYETAPITRLQISGSENDVGTIFPEEAGEKNTYRIVGNPLLTAQTADELQQVASVLFARLQGVRYTPCTLTVPAGTSPKPGEIITVTDRNGHTARVYVMQRQRNGGKDTVTCTGSPSLDSTAVVNDQSYRTLAGKVLRLRTDVEGILAENADTKGNFSSLTLTLNGIAATVENQLQDSKTAISTLEQTAKGLSATVQTLLDDGVTKLSTAFGLTIDESAVTIHREGSEMENRLDETGMYVNRGGDVILQANADGVIATDVTVRNYLVVGDHARFEDYGSGRTACFYV